jgi:hypothetical protein
MIMKLRNQPYASQWEQEEIKNKGAVTEIVTTHAAARFACAVEPALISDINFFQYEFLTIWMRERKIALCL